MEICSYNVFSRFLKIAHINVIFILYWLYPMYHTKLPPFTVYVGGGNESLKHRLTYERRKERKVRGQVLIFFSPSCLISIRSACCLISLGLPWFLFLFFFLLPICKSLLFHDCVYELTFKPSPDQWRITI